MGLFQKKKKNSADELSVPKPDDALDADLLRMRKRIEASDAYEQQIAKLPENSKSFNAIEKSGIINKTKDRLWPERTYLINMELRNGMHKTFMISITKNFFKFMDGTYIIDPQMQYFNVDARTYSLDYHQDLPLPLKREVPVKELQKTIKELSKIDPDQLVTAMNPLSLENFIEGKVIEQLMKAQEIDAFFKQARLIIIIILVEVTAILLYLLKVTGAFSNIKLPGIG